MRTTTRTAETTFPLPSPCALVQENELACQAQLNKFPLVVQTPLLRRRVDDLNEKLKEIDAAKTIFGRARVSKRQGLSYRFFLAFIIW